MVIMEEQKEGRKLEHKYKQEEEEEQEKQEEKVE